jgi:MFS family permease
VTRNRYKWIALSNTTLGVLMATLDASIVIIAMPAIFRGIGLDPLAPANIGYLLWMILGYLLVSAVLVVTLGREVGVRRRARIDWIGNLTFTAGTAAILVSITHGIQPYGGHATGWSSPTVLGGLAAGIVLLIVFCIAETKVAEPMIRLSLFRIRAFAAGNLAALLTAIARGGLQFMLIIWLQGIWLPLHGFNFEDTPLWAGIYMLPLTAGFLIAGPVSGYLSDRFGARLFSTGGLVLVAAGFVGLLALPVDFSYPTFAGLLVVSGIGQGMFSAPNTSAIMSSVPPGQRGVASGMRSTFQNSGTALSIGVFFSLMIAGLASSLPSTLTNGLTAHGVPADVASQLAHLPPVSTLFAAFLGNNPIGHLLQPTGVLGSLPAHSIAVLTGNRFFPELISGPFHHGLVIVFAAAASMAVIAALASLSRGRRYLHEDRDSSEAAAQQVQRVAR